MYRTSPFLPFIVAVAYPASEGTTAITIIIIIIIIIVADAIMIITTGQARPRRGNDIRVYMRRCTRTHACIPFKGMSSLGETKRRKMCTTLWGMD